jgi:HEAT repeat protein
VWYALSVRVTTPTLLFVVVAAWSASAAPADRDGKHRPGSIDVGLLVAQLADADPEVAARAAVALGDSDQPAAHDALLDALALGMSTSVAGVAVGELVKHPAPPDVPAIVRYTHHHDPGMRAIAVGALAGYPDPAARQAVVSALHDANAMVRTAAAAAAARAHVRASVDPLLQLLGKGEEPAARALAQLADPELAARVADQLGRVPEPVLALCLGQILLRADFGPDPARVEVVRALEKIRDHSASLALGDYVDKTPRNPPRPSRAEAERFLGEGGHK